MANSWKVPAFSLATTFAVSYLFCVIFDALFQPFGLIAAMASAIPWPISGGPLGFLTGFAMFIGAGFALGALHGIATEFWREKLR